MRSRLAEAAVAGVGRRGVPAVEACGVAECATRRRVMNRPACADVHSARQGRVGLRGSRRLGAGSAEWVCNGNVRRRHARADLAHDLHEWRLQVLRVSPCP